MYICVCVFGELYVSHAARTSLVVVGVILFFVARAAVVVVLACFLSPRLPAGRSPLSALVSSPQCTRREIHDSGIDESLYVAFGVVCGLYLVLSFRCSVEPHQHIRSFVKLWTSDRSLVPCPLA